MFSAALLALLAAYGWAAVTRWLPRVWRWGTLAIALVCMAVDLWPVGLRTNQLAVSPFYSTIPSASGGAILELPYQPDSSAYSNPIGFVTWERIFSRGLRSQTPARADAHAQSL